MSSHRFPLAAALLLTITATVTRAPAPRQPPAPQTRTYYIAADEVPWDYVPGGRDEIAGRAYADSAFFAKAKPRPVSTVYQKVLYREYTDSTFQTLKPRPPEWQHLGFLGPLIRGVVGDTIRVVFRNNGDRPYSIHPHGVFYDKNSEGVPYNDGTSGSDKADDGVPPRSHLCLPVAGARARRPGTDGRQLGDVDVPLPRRRSPRHQHRTIRPDDHHRARQGAGRRVAHRRGPRDRRLVHAGRGTG